MQFKVPQFIEMESKIIGSLTFKQVVYVGGSVGISYVLLKILPAFLSIILIIVVLIFGWALAFLPKRKYGKPFISIVESAFKYFIKERLYVWKRGERKPETEEEEIAGIDPVLFIPKISEGKLQETAKKLEVG